MAFLLTPTPGSMSVGQHVGTLMIFKGSGKIKPYCLAWFHAPSCLNEPVFSQQSRLFWSPFNAVIIVYIGWAPLRVHVS